MGRESLKLLFLPFIVKKASDNDHILSHPLEPNSFLLCSLTVFYRRRIKLAYYPAAICVFEQEQDPKPFISRLLYRLECIGKCTVVYGACAIVNLLKFLGLLRNLHTSVYTV